ncbi:MAG: site-specific DNA-methyltransferase [Candidatus Komeilibacteria bacterium]|nr:site-specific DNA-methyltransferase [Candidatus Komeilibacteria bacterium]
MTNKKQKLELTWIGKDEELKLEPRILIEDPDKSYGDPKAENMLIYGDNLLALKALEQDFSGQIRCIFIDPPYNTGSAFEHYDDNLEHSTWLSLMRPRLEIIHQLLASDGSLWITIDDNEAHYLKVLCDEVFGRSNFVGNVVWQKFHSVKTNAQYRLSAAHDHILIYKKSEALQNFNYLSMDEDALKVYKNPDNDFRGPWRTAPLTVGLLGGARGKAFAKTGQSTGLYEIVAPNGKKHWPSKGRCWISRKGFDGLVAENKIWWGKDGNAVPMRKLFLSESGGKKVCNTFWPHDEVGSNKTANEEQRTLFPQDTVFSTPKPERLLERIIHLASNTNDIVLDSFLGSGTTSAVAHKMGRRHIGVEFGEHVNTHCLPRLKKVVDGNDGLPLSETLDWKGGGGFKFYNLASSLLRKDSFGNFVIDENYNANMLAAAMCKHEGFKFYPDETLYWKHGKSTETDFIFVTTGFITAEQLDKVHSEMKADESLLICAKAYAPECENHFANITIKKIPQMILGRCEFGKDNYDLNIIKATEAEA